MVKSNLSPEDRAELIRNKAYELYVQRGRTPGKELEDWLSAEKQVDRELQASPRNEPQSRLSPVTPIASSAKVGGFKRASG